jgi:hypothetical protein
VVAEPGLVAARSFESKLRVIPGRTSFTCSDGDQGVGSVPTEMVNGKHQTRFVSDEQFKCAPVLVSNGTSSDDVWEIEISLGLEIGEHGFPSESCFVGCQRFVYAAEGEMRRGSIDVRLGVIEIVIEFEVAIEELQGDLWMGAGQCARLDAEVLLFPSRTTEFLIERAFNGVVPRRVAKPVSAHRLAA